MPVPDGMLDRRAVGYAADLRVLVARLAAGRRGQDAGGVGERRRAPEDTPRHLVQAEVQLLDYPTPWR